MPAIASEVDTRTLASLDQANRCLGLRDELAERRAEGDGQCPEGLDVGVGGAGFEG